MRSLLSLAVLPLVFLSGCAWQQNAHSSLTAGPSLRGTVHGGQQPISGAHLYLLAASTGGYGQGSTSLLNPTLLPSDTLGAYVTTDASGSFSITTDYTCTTNTQVYLYAKGGNAGSGSNAAISLLAALGSCPTAGTFAGTVPDLVINEVTTVAAAYALAGFAADPTHIASSSPALAQTGLANAFLNAGNLANIVNGSALLTTPAGNGTAPQARVNTLANMIAACINSNPSSSTTCSSLFSNAQASGVSPTDTAAAIINIAHNPGANIATLYGLASSTPPFAPALGSQPSDFTLPITYTGARLSDFPTGGYGGQGGLPGLLAADGLGNIFTTCGNLGAIGIDKFSSVGADLSSSATFVGNTTDAPGLIAIDTNNNVWVLNGAKNHANLAEFSNSGTLLSGAGYTGGALISTTYSSTGGLNFDPSGNIVVAVGNGFARFNASGQPNPPTVGYPASGYPVSSVFDPLGDLWYAGGNGLFELLPSGAAASGAPGTGISLGIGSDPLGLAIDRSNDVWVVNATNRIGVYNSAGQPLFASGIAYPGANAPVSIALDGVGTAFIGDSNDIGNGSQLVRIVTSGSTLTSTAVYGTGFLNTVSSNVVLDGSGNAWMSDFLEGPVFGDARLIQFVGIAAPVVTPFAAAVAAGTLASRP